MSISCYHTTPCLKPEIEPNAGCCLNLNHSVIIFFLLNDRMASNTIRLCLYFMQAQVIEVFAMNDQPWELRQGHPAVADDFALERR